MKNMWTFNKMYCKNQKIGVIYIYFNLFLSWSNLFGKIKSKNSKKLKKEKQIKKIFSKVYKISTLPYKLFDYNSKNNYNKRRKNIE